MPVKEDDAIAFNRNLSANGSITVIPLGVYFHVI